MFILEIWNFNTVNNFTYFIFLCAIEIRKKTWKNVDVKLFLTKKHMAALESAEFFKYNLY